VRERKLVRERWRARERIRIMIAESSRDASRAAGVRVIVAYKYAKAVAEALLAALLAALVATGYIAHARALAAALRENLVHHWSIRVAELVLRSLTGHRIYWVAAALAGDAIVSVVEGVALARGYSWGAWLVVGATSLLLPIEIIELASRFTLGRLAIFAINLAIVLYLLRRQMREHHAAHPHASPQRLGP
jgi:uncharacterized membrane protein (DUF2068 family)